MLTFDYVLDIQRLKDDLVAVIGLKYGRTHVLIFDNKQQDKTFTVQHMHIDKMLIRA